MNRNPFQFGLPLLPENVVDREDEVARVKRVLLESGRMFVVGPRRFGKTSILRRAVAEAQEASLPCVFVNAEAYMNLEELASAIATQATKLLPTSLRERIALATKWFAHLQPQVSYDPITDNVSVSVRPREATPASDTISDVLDAVNQIGDERGARIGVLIDEFQELTRREGIHAERRLRAVTQLHHNMAYVFAGSDTQLMYAMVSKHNRPFYRSGDVLTVGPVPRPDMEAFLREGFQTIGVAMTDSALELIFSLSEDVPYNIQKLAVACYERAQSTQLATLSAADVEQAFESVLARDHANYHTLFRSLTPMRRRILYTLTDPALRDATLAAIARKVPAAYSTVQAAKNTFVDEGLIREVHETLDRPSYRLIDPFMRPWIDGFAAGRYA